MNRLALLAVFAVMLLLAGSGRLQAESTELRKVPRVWAAEPPAAKREIDSLAAGRVAGGVRVFATCKKRHVVDVYDAVNGKFLQTLGRKGSAPGEFNLPNGVALLELPDPSRGAAKTAVLLVVERDNRRVQAFDADTLAPLGSFGVAELSRPYGITVALVGDEAYAWVTDTRVPAEQRVRQYSLALHDARLTARPVRSFGDNSPRGEIRTPESLIADVDNRRLYLCDEDDDRNAINVKVYDLDGRFTGQTFADQMVQGEPEGIAVVAAPGGPPGAGIVILTDQRKNLSVWHVFNRQSLKPLYSFTGEPTIANTDGICVLAEAFENFPAGAFFAVHDDDQVHAFRLEEVWPELRDSVRRD